MTKTHLDPTLIEHTLLENTQNDKIMTYTPRPTFSFDKNPRFIWEEVQVANPYNIKIINKETSEIFWEIDVTNPQCENGYCQCDYPQDQPFLEELVPYLIIIIAKTTNGESLKEFETEVILLEANAQLAVQGFEALLESEGTLALKEKWLKTKDTISAFKKAWEFFDGEGKPPTCAIGSCIRANFN